MRTGTSASGYTLDFPIPFSLHRIRRAGFDCADFNFYDFSRPDGPLAAPDWRDWLALLRRALRESGLTPFQAHALFNVYAPADLTFEPPEDIFLRTLNACEALNCRELVFHPVFLPTAAQASDEAMIDYNARWFRRITQQARDCGVHIDIENVFVFNPEISIGPFATARGLLALLDAISDDQVGVCLDTGHAHIAGQRLPEMIHALGGRLRALHLNDNLGPIAPVYSDQHLLPGQGTIDFVAAFKALQAIGFEGTLNLEPGGFMNRLPLAARDAALAGGAQVLRALAAGAGMA